MIGTFIKLFLSFFTNISNVEKPKIVREPVKKPVVEPVKEVVVEEPVVEPEPIVEEEKQNDMNITDKFLEKGEYYEEVFEKNVFYLHHTAGGHRADWVIHGWDTDDNVDSTGKKSPRSVATSYVIGGLSTRDKNDTAFDGKVYRCFDDKYWAHHLGTSFRNNKTLNRNSVAVEICNYGPLTKGGDGKFYTYVNSVVPNDMVVELDKPFRGYKYYHKYTDKQIAATKELILFVKQKHPKIELRTPLLTVDGFELHEGAKAGVSGIFSHSNVRNDKYDMYPDLRLINMLKEVCKPM